MRSRWWIGIIALFGVLLHAGAIVRHNSVMLGATLQYQALVTDLAQICHGGGTGGDVSSELPFIPKPSDAQNDCPVCSGLSPVFALTGPQLAGLALPLPAASRVEIGEVTIPVARYASHPPVRGPPRLA